MTTHNLINDAVFKYVLAVTCLIIGLILHGFSNSTIGSIKPIYTLQKPIIMQSNGLNPYVFQVPITIKKHTKYLLNAKVSGNPDVRFDFYGEKYDSGEQETNAPQGDKKNFVVNAIFNSNYPPPPCGFTSILFRQSTCRN